MGVGAISMPTTNGDICETSNMRLMKASEIPAFVDKVIEAGCDICAIGHLGYSLGDVDGKVPWRKADLPRPFQVVLKYRNLFGGELLAVNIEVSLVIEPQRTLVEIGRAAWWRTTDLAPSL